jgi:membrane-associated phospholipid phosphatase
MTGMDVSAIAAAPRFESLPRLKPRITIPIALLAVAGGAGIHMAALWLIEHYVRTYPSVPDVAESILPYVNFGIGGELCFAAILISATLVLAIRQPRTLPGILAMIGSYYAIRGLFLFALPIGAPPTAPMMEARFVLYPFAGHAYFPGGHAGLMTILGMSMTTRLRRVIFLAITAVFAFGTVIARTHYVADVLGGALIGYAVFSWMRSNFDIGTATAGPARVLRLPARERLAPLLP